MLSTIYLDVTTGDRRSTAKVCLSKSDIKALYSEAFADVCPSCGGKMGNSIGGICCKCFSGESVFHTDCCLAEGEEQ